MKACQTDVHPVLLIYNKLRRWRAYLLSAHVYILSRCVAMQAAGVILAVASHVKGLGR